MRMFMGTLPHKAIKIIGNVVKEWDCERIYVGCSGNFTIERSISELVNSPITSNDVTIYSSYIGKYFAGESLSHLKIKDDYSGNCRFLGEYMNTDTEKIATMILASDILQYDDKRFAYQERMLNGYKDQYPRIHKKLCDKLESCKLKVDKFYHGDVMDMLDLIPKENSGFLSFPPFFKGGYEKMWKNIEAFFEYEEPNYVMFDPDVHIKTFCDKVKAIDNFIIVAEREVPEMEEYFIGCLNTGPNKLIYFYSKTKANHYVSQGGRETKGKPLIKISPDDEITEDIQIRQISLDQFIENRALYLSVAVTKVGTPSISYGLFNKGKCFGIFAFSNSMMLTGSDKLEKPTVYLLTDFAISPSKEKNLSKLVLYCILSKEVKMLAEKLLGKRVNSIATNAFSKNPISMKYRGLFELNNRKELEKDENGKVKKYNLSYGTKAGQWTIKEGYELWRQKSSK